MNKKLTKPVRTGTKTRAEHIAEVHEKQNHFYTPRYQYDDSCVSEPRTLSYSEWCPS